MSTSEVTSARGARRIAWLKAAPFFAIQIAAVAGIFWYGWSWSGALLAVALYYVRMFGVTGAYHRYFSHRTYRTSRAFQLLLALLAMTSVQKGVLWWASHHRTIAIRISRTTYTRSSKTAFGGVTWAGSSRANTIRRTCRR